MCSASHSFPLRLNYCPNNWMMRCPVIQITGHEICRGGPRGGGGDRGDRPGPHPPRGPRQGLPGGPLLIIYQRVSPRTPHFLGVGVWVGAPDGSPAPVARLPWAGPGDLSDELNYFRELHPIHFSSRHFRYIFESTLEGGTFLLFYRPIFWVDVFRVDTFSSRHISCRQISSRHFRDDVFQVDIFPVDKCRVDIFIGDIFRVDVFRVENFRVDDFRVDIFQADIFRNDVFLLDIFLVDIFESAIFASSFFESTIFE